MEGRFRLEITYLASELQTPTPPGGMLTTLSGNYETIFKGAGLEFKDFRRYGYGDSARRIDWKASLKGNKLLIKEFQEERNAEVLFCYDVSSGMIFGSKKLKAQYGAEFISSLGKHIIDANDAIGLVTFNDDITNFIPPSIGQQHIGAIMDLLSKYSTYGGKSSFKKILEFLDTRILQGTTVLIVSDFFSFRKYRRYEKLLKTLRSKFELIFVIMRDPIEEFLTSKQKEVLLVDPQTNLNMLINTKKIRKKYIIETKKEKDSLKEFAHELNIPVLEIYTDRGFVDPLYKFFQELMYNR